MILGTAAVFWVGIVDIVLGGEVKGVGGFVEGRLALLRLPGLGVGCGVVRKTMREGVTGSWGSGCWVEGRTGED